MIDFQRPQQGETDPAKDMLGVNVCFSFAPPPQVSFHFLPISLLQFQTQNENSTMRSIVAYHVLRYGILRTLILIS
jgi:hypothetical protein